MSYSSYSTNRKTNGKIASVVLVVSRLLLGIVFLFSGFVKAVDPLGTAYKIEDYLVAFGGFFADMTWISLPASIALFTLEFMLGVCLVFNVMPKSTSWIAFLFMLLMTPLTLYVAIENPVSDCGCFGDALVLDNWTTFYKNIVLFVLALVVLILSRRTYATFLPAVEWSIIGVFAVLILGLATYCLLTLPVIDFRPYKVGVNISEQMEIPEGATPDVYETTFVYAQNGLEKEFTLENYPKDDSTWVFVRQNTKLIQQGYVPPIHDFSIVTESLEDITYDILDNPGYTVLVIMYDLNKTNMRQAHKLNNFYEQSQIRGAGFYALTASGNADIENFRQRTGATYPFCFTDPITLKTIIRANPGIMLLKNGVIQKKWNVRFLQETSYSTTDFGL